MKKCLLTATFLITGIVSSFSQGAIKFSNFESHFTDGLDRKVYLDSVGGNPVVDPTWTATLVRGDEALTSAQPFLGPFAPGQWLFADLSLANTPAGQPTTLAVRIANAAGTVVATSPTFAYTPPSSPTAPPDQFLMINFRAFAVPEPSTIALGVLGLGALLLFRRRK